MAIVFLTLTGYLSFTIMDFLIQFLLQHYSIFQVSFFNALSATIFVILLIPVILGWGSVKIRSWKLHLFRGILIATMDLAAFYSYADNSIASAYSLILTGPLWAALFDWVIAHKKSSRFMWIASLFTFIGVLVVLNPTYQGGSITLFFALFSAIVDGYCIYIYRHWGKKETTASFVLTGSMITAIVLCPLWLWKRTSYTWEHLGMNMISGFCLAFAALLVLYCFRRKEILLIGSLQYSQIIWAIVLNLGVYGLWPSPQVLIGSTMVIAGGILLIWSSSHKSITPDMVERI